MQFPKAKDLGKAWMKVYGPLPDDYLVFDLETSGLDPDRDVILELGWTRVFNRTIKESGAHTLNWHGLISETETEILRNRLLKTDNNMSKKGLDFNWSIDKISRYGIDPKIAFMNFAKFLAKSPILVGHNLLNFDLRHLDKCARRLTGIPLGIPETRAIDTLALVRAIQSGVTPVPGETYKQFCLRALSAGGNKYKGALDKFCVQNFQLDIKYGVDTSKMHRAEADCIANAHLFEEIRKLMFEP